MLTNNNAITTRVGTQEEKASMDAINKILM